MAHATCSADGCSKPVAGRGLCDRHYRQAKESGRPLPPVKDRKRSICLMDGCEQWGHSHGYCGTHWRRVKLYGSPFVTTQPYIRGGGKRLMTTGYIQVWRPEHPMADTTGYVLEHRMVAYDTGLLTGRDRSVHVHHLNGDKADNRPDNLAVKTASDHISDHVHEQGFVENQYGIWPLRRAMTG